MPHRVEKATRRVVRGRTAFKSIACLLLWVSLIGAVSVAHGRDRITAAVLADFPPLYVTDENGNPDGFALDIFREVTQSAGLEFNTLVVKNWAEAMNAVRAGMADVIPGIGISPTRQAEFLFTGVFETIPVSCFVRADSFDITGISDLIGRRTAVINKSAAQTKLDIILGMYLVRFDSVDEALFSLLVGKVDAFVFPEPVLWRKAQILDLENQIKVVGKPLMELRRGYLLREDSPALTGRLDKALGRFVASSEFAEIYMKWWGKPKPFWTAPKVFIACAIALFLCVATLVAWRYFSIIALNRQLRQNMEERLVIEDRLRASEQRLLRSQEIANFGSFERDLVTGKGYWSDNMFKLMGLPPAEQAPSFEDFVTFLHPDDRAEYLRTCDSMTIDSPERTFEYRFRPKGKKEYRYALCSQIHEFAKAGFPIRRIGSIQDISERKAMNAALVQAKEKAETANRAKSEFLANMSHELRTPLNGALGMLQLLAMDNLAPTHREYVKTAISSCRSLTDLLGDILDISRVEAGKMELTVKEFDPADILDSVHDTFSRVAEDKGIEFIFMTSPDLPPRLEGDSARLRQVLFNLVGNALKFTDKGSVTVDTSMMGRNDDSCRLLFSVRDTGIGIPDDMINKVFGAFTQVDGAYSRKFGGTGLGLHIVKRLAELMDGNISVETKLGEGTSVHFNVPFGIPGYKKTEKAVRPAIYAQSNGSRHVLIAEDDRVNQIALAKLVERLGHTVDIVSNGEEALASLARNEYDLILMDIQMPVVNGVEATRRIRKAEYLGLRKDIPIVALTAHAMAGDRERFLAQGMTDYLAKPVDIEELQQMLEKTFPGQPV